MADALSSGVFDSEFLTHPPRWFGRIVSKESWADNIAKEKFDQLSSIQGWGYRYKVRIFSWHTGDKNEIPDDQLVMANVVLPVTAGSGLGGASQTPSLEPGSVVTGFFMDGMGGQEPYIDGVLGNSNNNVPKQQGDPSPTQPQKKQLPANIDSLSSSQLNKFLNPARTPTTAEFKAASEARQLAKAQGKSKAEIERLVKLATVKAQAQAATDQAKIDPKTLGYAVFNNTYSDSSKKPALVPDDRVIGNAPISTVDAVHAETKASEQQDEDRKRQQELQSVCKENNSEEKGISTVLTNLVNDINKARKFTTEVSSLANQIEVLVDSAAPAVSNYVKSTLTGVRGLILETISKEIDKQIDKLYPTEISDFKDTTDKALDELSCAFNKIITGLLDTVKSLLKELINKVVNTPLCVAQKFLTDLLDNILGQITDILDVVLAPLKAFLGVIPLVTATLQNVAEFFSGLASFFSCDEKPSCPDYDTMILGGISIPGPLSFDTPDLPSAPPCPTGLQQCGPPKIEFFGGAGEGGLANLIISPSTSSIIGVDIVNPGKYLNAPFASIVDNCGKGSGAVVKPFLNSNGGIAGAVVEQPGDGYLSTPDGTQGANGQTLTGDDADGEASEDAIAATGGDPVSDAAAADAAGDAAATSDVAADSGNNVLANEVSENLEQYPVILCLDEIVVVDGGFGYQPGDEIIIIPDNGTVVEPVVNSNGQIEAVKIISGGCGYTDLPEILTNSKTGFNAQMLPVLKVNLVEDLQEVPPGVELVNVVDCVGRVI